MNDTRLPLPVIFLAAALAGAVYFADLVLPMGAMGGALYLFIVPAGFWMGRVRWVWLMAALSSALIVIGYFQSPAREAMAMEPLHRLFALAADLGLALLFTVTLKAQARLRDREAMHRSIMEGAVDGIITIDARGAVQSMNPAAVEIFGYSEAEVLGKNISLLMPSPLAEEHDGYLAKYLDTGEKNIIGTGREVVGQRRNGEMFQMDLGVSEIRRGGEPMFVGFIRDLTEREKAEEILHFTRHLEEMVRIDDLTGLLNRRVLMESLEVEVARAKRFGSSLSILMIDLDHFKSVNDTHGHVMGDEVLARSAGLIAESVRATDIAARLGGEEFCVLLPETPIEGGREFAERIRAQIAGETYIGAGGKEFAVTCSVGIAQYCEDDSDATNLIERADKALYQAKNEGRNRTCAA